MVKVGIVTVNFNGKEDTLELLKSLRNQSEEGIELLTIVVDNGSGDGLAGELKEKYPDVLLLQNGINKGFSGGYNRGLEHALIWGADYVLIINNDAVIRDREFIQKMLDPFKSGSEIGIVSPKIYFAKGYEFHHDRYKDNELGKVLWFAGGSFDWENVYSQHRGIDQVDTGSFDTVEEAEFLTGCCMMIRREVLDRSGMFNDDYFAYVEDADLCMRVTQAGYKLIYNGKASIDHKVSKTSGVGSAITDYYLTRNRLQFGMKYASGRTRFALMREAVRMLVTGRAAQKNGVRDYFCGRRGPKNKQLWNDDAEFSHLLSVVSVNYNTPDLIEGLLKSIFADPENKAYDIIVLDNGSEHGCEAVVDKYPGVRFVKNETNTGFTGGYNKAMRYALGKHILMLNSDIEATKGSLTEIARQAENFKSRAIVSGSLYFPGGDLQDSVFFLPTVWGAIKEYFLGIKGSFFMYAPPQNKITRVEAAAMACYLIPQYILEKIGFLNEKLFTYFEDVDYCRRAKKIGIPIYYTPSARFIHHHGATGKRLKEGKAYQMLVRASKIYHGLFYYHLLSFVLRVAQKVSRVKTPVAR